MCDAENISAHDLAEAVLAYINDPANSGYTSALYTADNSSYMDYYMTISENKVYFGGLSG